MYSLSTPGGGEKLSLFSLYGQPFSRYGSILITSMFGHEICNLKNGPKDAYVLFFCPQGLEIELTVALRASVFEIRTIFNISMFGYSIWNLKKGPKVSYLVSFCPMGLKMSLFLLYGQWLSRYGSISI